MHKHFAGACVRCTNIVAHAEFTSINSDTCAQTCKPGYYAIGQNPLKECRTCSTSPCPVGFTRQPCSSTSDGTCTPCTNPKPTLSHYISAGPECEWECDSGFELDISTGACLARRQPDLLVINRSLVTWVNADAEPASFMLVLSQRPPLQRVKVILTAYEQLQPTRPGVITFTPGVFLGFLLCVCVCVCV